MDRYTFLAVIRKGSLSLSLFIVLSPPRSRLSSQRLVRLLSTFTRSILSVFIVPFSKRERKREKFLIASLDNYFHVSPRRSSSIVTDRIFGSSTYSYRLFFDKRGTNSYRDPIISARLITVIKQGVDRDGKGGRLMKEVVRHSKLIERPHSAALGTDPHGTVNYIRRFLARAAEG